ncbi:efflux RND transporter periplasmic adaptor subunit [Simiduia aestuariiviva]|uniref:HlyD family secretion protein n=1 Tax=Simiduia aestuariiviva TaxID=1510459 RepID=A0A839UV45_9GAMM|nr:efflux RND transporter periplasmic adaptor subunit [Simiduia aestuariiviva]MBB3169225.1 HlyD family secretion protein [Simiduia aestuariiviva]
MIRDTSGQDRVLAPSRRQQLRPLLLLGVGVLCVSGLVWAGLGGGGASKSMAADELRFSRLTQGTLVRDVATSGKIVAANAPILYSTEAGVVTLLRNPGDTVAQGDVLAIVDSPELANALQQQQSVLTGMEGELARAKLNARRDQLKANQALDMAAVDRDAAQRENRRAEQLMVNNLISKMDLEKSKDDLYKAQLLFEHAKQEAQLTKDTLSFELENKALEVERQQLVIAELQRKVAALNITAPMDGIIGNWLTEQKARLAASQPVLTVVSLTDFEAELAVPETYADELGLGMDVELNIGGTTILGQLASLSPEVRNREVTARVRFEHDAGLKLRQNQRLSARILLEHRANVLMVSRGAFLSSGGSVAYVRQGNRLLRIPVELGARSMSHVEVIAGGSAGDEWVVSDLQVFDGASEVQVN